MPNQYVNKVVQSNGTTLIDISDTTAVAADVASGKYFYLATGEKVEGSGSGGGGGMTTEVIVPEQTVTSSQEDYQLTYSEAIVQDQWYLVTINGTGKVCTGITLWGGVQLFYAYYVNVSYYANLGVCLEITSSSYYGTYTVKVEKITSGVPIYVTKSITANGTYSAEDDNADGYSSVTVNVPSGGASSWTKVAETSYQVSTTSTSATTVETWATGSSDLWTSSKWVYVRIRDTAGKREGYYYGGDQFFYNINPINGTTDSYYGYILNLCIRYSSGAFAVTNSINAGTYGIYADRLYSDGRLRIRRRYNSTNTLTINGTYKVEVYLLDPAGGVPIFE